MVYPTYWLAVSWICLCFKSKWAVSFRFVSQGIYLFHFLLLKKEWPSSTNHPPFFTCLFIYLSRASYCWRVNQKRRPFKKYDHSHSSYTMPEQTWNILSVFIDFWRKSSENRSSFHRWVISRDVKHKIFSLISYWLRSSACKIKPSVVLQMLKFF